VAVEVFQEVEWVPNQEEDSGAGKQLVVHNEEAQEAWQILGLGREAHNLGPRTTLPNMQVGLWDRDQTCCNWRLCQILPWWVLEVDLQSSLSIFKDRSHATPKHILQGLGSTYNLITCSRE
jgi:hypothetical protein